MVVTVKLDAYGKIFIPKGIREQLHSNEFEIVVKEDVIELIPLKSPVELFGTLKSLDMSVLDEIHGEDHEYNA